MQRHNVEKNKIEKQIENLIRRVSIFGIDTRFYFYGGLGFSGKRQTGMITSKQAWVTDKKVLFSVFWVRKLLKGLTGYLTVSPLYSFSPFLYKQSFYPIYNRVASAPYDIPSFLVPFLWTQHLIQFVCLQYPNS